MHFSEFILANTRLYALRNDKTLSTKAVANFTRNELATALRKASHLSSQSAESAGRSLLEGHKGT